MARVGLEGAVATKSEVMLMALAAKEGLIGKDQVQACMNKQKDLAEQGKSVRLEDLVVRNGFLTERDIAGLKAPPLPEPITLEEARKISIYDVHEPIGQGGMATVFSATHRETGEARAVKVLYHEHVANKVFVERFLREGKLLKTFDCANIAKGFEYGRAGKRLYFMGMELVDGPSLQDILDHEGPFGEDKAVYCITEAARALAYMQARGLVHRDIKPENIMWNSDGRVMLVDLGFAKSIQGDADEAEYEAETCGTVQYISPEQAKGKADLDVRADIYSLGATLYHLVVGKLPFTGKDSMEVMAKQVMESLDSLTLKGGKISMHMHYFIEKMMAKDREIRYQTSQEIVEDIEAVLAGAADLQFDMEQQATTSFAPTKPPTSKISSSRMKEIKTPSQRTSAISSGRNARVSTRVTKKPSGKIPRQSPTESATGGSNTKSVRLPTPRRATGRVTNQDNTSESGQNKSVRFPQRKRSMG